MLNQALVDGIRHAEIQQQGHFIDGRTVAAVDGGMLDVVSPIDGRVLTQIADGSARDVDLAVAAARKAFDDGRWSRMPPQSRKKVLLRLGDLIEAHALELAVLGVRDNGTEIGMAFKAEALSAAATFRYYGEAIDKVYGQIAPTA
ncbi:MAG: aldehyde dehydrogenase family protein, partial [Marivita sp.]